MRVPVPGRQTRVPPRLRGERRRPLRHRARCGDSSLLPVDTVARGAAGIQLAARACRDLVPRANTRHLSHCKLQGSVQFCSLISDPLRAVKYVPVGTYFGVRIHQY